MGSGETVSFDVIRENEGKMLSAEVGPNLDPQADSDEAPVHDAALAPFFLSKYEMTQGQWKSFTGENPSYYSSGNTYGDKKASLLDPVEHVSWEECNDVLSRLGLVSPTEVQWAYRELRNRERRHRTVPFSRFLRRFDSPDDRDQVK